MCAFGRDRCEKPLVAHPPSGSNPKGCTSRPDSTRPEEGNSVNYFITYDLHNRRDYGSLYQLLAS